MPTIHLDGPIEDAALASAFRQHIALILVDYLPRQRWFGDKERAIVTVVFTDVAICACGDDWHVLALIDVRFHQGSAAYFLPLTVTAPSAPLVAAPLVRLVAQSREWHVSEALAVPAFQRWLLDQLAADRELRGEQGRFRWSAYDTLDSFLGPARAGGSRLSGADQSNSAVVYGDALILKAFRRLQAGVNPDEEVGRFLAERTAFRRIPLPVGSVAYVSDDERDGYRSIALVQCYEPSVGDGWSYLLDRLQKAADDRTGTAGPALALEDLRGLGTRTGQLHTALATDSSHPGFAPEPTTAVDVAGWRTASLAALTRTRDLLRDRPAGLPQDARELAAAFVARTDELAHRLDGFLALTGTAKIRVHGDYHLGQVLRTPDADWVILDFEGEPARPIEERRAKTSPLKDVAGMLRSFAYARGAVLRQNDDREEQESPRAAWLSAWEANARAAFLSGYRVQTADRGAAFVPADAATFDAALAAWELDKALYEVHYELNHRPAFVSLPLAGILDRRA